MVVGCKSLFHVNVRENLNLLYLLRFHVPFSLVWSSLCVAEDLSRPLYAVEKRLRYEFCYKGRVNRVLVLCYMQKKITVMYTLFSNRACS